MIQVKCYTLSLLILNFKLEKSMHVQITQKTVQQQKYGIIFLGNINVTILGIWASHWKEIYFISRKRLYKKRTHKKCNLFWKEKKMLPLTKEELKSHQDAKVCYISRKRILKYKW